MISIFQRNHNELTKTVKRVHSLEDLSENDDNANEDKNEICYIGDISKKVGKGTGNSSKHGRKKTRKRQSTSKSNSESLNKAKKIPKKRV